MSQKIIFFCVAFSGLGSSYERPKILPYANDDAYSYTISRDDSRSPTTFLLDLEDTSLMTSDTLTMVPAGSHQRQRSSSMYDDTSGKNLKKILFTILHINNYNEIG